MLITKNFEKVCKLDSILLVAFWLRRKYLRPDHLRVEIFNSVVAVCLGSRAVKTFLQFRFSKPKAALIDENWSSRLIIRFSVMVET